MSRWVLISGAAAGIGLATARRLAALGADIVGLDVQTGVAGFPGILVAGDVCSPGSWDGALAIAARRAGGVDGVVLAAGIASPPPATLADLSAIRRVVEVDLLGVICGVRASLPVMRRGGGGAIVAVASLAGLNAYPPDPVYAAAKHGVVGFVRSIAPALLDHGITANVVYPGLTDTGILPAEVRCAVRREAFPLLAPDAIAGAIAECLDGSETGQGVVCQPGREPVRYRFRGIPGPAGGATPPPYGGQLGA